MPSVSPYLNFSNSCEAAFTFYKSVFGGEFFNLMRFADSPAEYRGDERENNKIMHVALAIGDKTVLMGSDVPEKMGPVTSGNNFSVALNPGSEEETIRLFNGLAAGGQVMMPLSQAFWGAFFGMLTDKFGVQWIVNFDPKHPM